MVRYIPILKGRQGEFDALRDIQLGTRLAITPLVEVAPSSDDPGDAAAISKACAQAAEKLAHRYSGHPLMLDTGLLDLSVNLAGGKGPVGYLADMARAVGLDSYPVLRLGDDKRAQLEAADAHAHDSRGCVFRLVGEDLDEDPDDLDASFDGMVSEMGIDRPDIDLLLDLGAVEGDVAVRGGARLVVSLMRDLPSIMDWRSVTVAAGAFPVDLSQFNAWVVGERPRYDAQLFDLVRSRKIPRQPDYGDYAIAHPLLTTGAPFAPPPQLRYTTAENWLILKGRRNDPRGNAQFQYICEIMARRPEFVGARLGRADERIATGSPEGPGNGTTWRAIATTHHIDLVARRLTTLGEP